MSSFVNLMDIVYPVGSVYMTNSAVSPATYFGGTWTKVEKKFIFAADDTDYTVESTGGEVNHTLTTDEIPSHSHGYPVCWMGDGSTQVTSVHLTYRDSGYSNNLTTWQVYNSGGGKSHNNMPPYQCFYIYYRVS